MSRFVFWFLIFICAVYACAVVADGIAAASFGLLAIVAAMQAALAYIRAVRSAR